MEEVEKIWPPVVPEPDPGNQRLLHTPPHSSHSWIHLQVLWLWESNMLLRASGWYTWWSPITTSLYKLLSLAGRCEDLLILQPPKTSLVSSLIKTASYRLEWPASFHLSVPSVCETIFRFHLGNLRLQTGGPAKTQKQKQNQRNGSWEKGVWEGNPELAFDLCVGRGASDIRWSWTPTWLRECPENASWSDVPVWGTVREHHARKGEATGLPLLGAFGLATHAWLEVRAWRAEVREALDHVGSPADLGAGWQETLACCSAELGGCVNWPRLRSEAL